MREAYMKHYSLYDNETTLRAFDLGYRAGLAQANANEQSQAQQHTNQEPLLTLILGGIEGDEYAENDVEWHTKAVEALQEKLVRGSDAIFVPLYMQSQAQQEPVLVAEVEYSTFPTGYPVAYARWKGKCELKAGTLLYTLPPVPEGGGK